MFFIIINTCALILICYHHNIAARPRYTIIAEKMQSSEDGMRRPTSTALKRANSVLYGDSIGEFSHSLAEACLSSAPILGERIDKGVLKRRIDKIEEQLEEVALLSELGDEVAYIMEQIARKVWVYWVIYMLIKYRSLYSSSHKHINIAIDV